MATINLLPWREELREKRQKEFYVIIGLVLAVAAGLVFLANSFYQSEIKLQNQRNNFLKTEMRVLDAKIDQIKTLRDTRNKLIDRMKLIQDLQGNRPVIVRVFDEVARSVPEDLYFDKLSISGRDVKVSGIAKSNNRVAALMRNFDQSDWFANPNLIKVQAKKEGVNEFEVSMTRVEPEVAEEQEQ